MFVVVRDEPERTQAERAYARLEPDRARAMAELEKKASSIGDHDTLARLAEIKVSGMTMDEVVTEMYRGLAAELGEAMGELGFDVSSAIVGSAVSDDVTAQVQGYSDRSALISVSDGISSLSILYSRHVAHRMSGLTRASVPRRLVSAIKMFVADDSGLDRDLLAGVLRYHNVHQRIYGRGAKVTLQLDDYQEFMANALNLHSMRFVVAHELAHHALGHLTDGGAFPHRSSQDDSRRETDADLLAFRATRLAAERSGTVDLFIIGLGVLLSIATLHCAERSLFIRTGTTHPPALDRAALVLGQLPAPRRSSAQLFFDDLVKATDDASDFTPGPPRVDWKRTLEHPEIYTPHPAFYLNQVIKLDQVQSLELNELAEMFGKLDEKHNTTTHDGARAALAGHPAAALAAWGLRDDLVQEMTDPGTALTYFALQYSLRASMHGTAKLSTTMRLLYATTAASLVQGRLRRTDAHGE